MGLSYIKRGATIDIYYEGFKRETGLTVQGNAYKPNGTIYAGQPFSFTHLTGGLYKATLTATSDDGWHVVLIDATDSGKSRPGVFKFRVQANSIQEIYDLVSTVNTNVLDVQTKVTDIQGTGFATGTDSLKAIRDAITSLQSSVNGIEGVVSGIVFLESAPELTIPTSGSIRYKLTLRNYSQTGMKDFDANPTVAVDAEGTDLSSTNLYSARTGGSLTTTMSHPSTGVYEIFFSVASTDTEKALTFVISATEDTEAKSFQLQAERVLSMSAAGYALESTLTLMKQTTSGTFDRDTDSLEALRDNQDLIKGVGFAGGTHDLVAIKSQIDDVLRYGGGGVH